MSRKAPIDFRDLQKDALEMLECLSFRRCSSQYPDFKKLIDLPTDASANGIGAVPSQGTLKESESHYV